MSNVHKFPPRQDLRSEEAGDWIAKLAHGLSEEEELALGAWLSSHPDNYESFMELARLWDSMDSLQRLAELFPEQPERKRFVMAKPAWMIAASVVFIAVMSTWFIRQEPVSPAAKGAQTVAKAATVYETAIGQQIMETLPDGSVIVLNTNSLLTVNYTRANRLLKLIRGEVHVIVAHDTSRPLSVMVGEKVVQAVGTEFNLEITSDQTIELLVADGLVMVGMLDIPAEEIPGDQSLVLAPAAKLVAAGQEVKLSMTETGEESLASEAIVNEDISVKLSWRNGNLIFRGESLEEAVSEIGRYTAVEFVFVDEEAKKVRVAGMFKTGDVEGLLAALRSHFHIAYEWQGADTILLTSE